MDATNIKKELAVPFLWIGWDKETLALCQKAVDSKKKPNEPVHVWADRLARTLATLKD